MLHHHASCLVQMSIHLRIFVRCIAVVNAVAAVMLIAFMCQSTLQASGSVLLALLTSRSVMVGIAYMWAVMGGAMQPLGRVAVLRNGDECDSSTCYHLVTTITVGSVVNKPTPY